MVTSLAPQGEARHIAGNQGADYPKPDDESFRRVRGEGGREGVNNKLI